MEILNKIVNDKYFEVEDKKELVPIKKLEQSIFFDTNPLSLKSYITREDKSGIIAEIKRKSPSKGILNREVSVEKISIGYMQAGASALSVLTDKNFFGGSNEDLMIARKFNFCPILRKEFIINEYQIIEAKSIGADAILLIAAVLDPEKIKSFTKIAHSLKMEVLLEVHNEEELNKNLDSGADLIGVNNRNLKTFEVSIQNSLDLVDKIPSNVVKISESGIHSIETIQLLKEAGFDGFLMGEIFMKQAHPEMACAEFIQKLRATV